MRVATRRLRAALEVFAPASRASSTRRCSRRSRTWPTALGERRDPDVAIEELEALAQEFAAGGPPGVAGLVDELRAEQAAANETVARALAERARERAGRAAAGAGARRRAS